MRCINSLHTLKIAQRFRKNNKENIKYLFHLMEANERNMLIYYEKREKSYR